MFKLIGWGVSYPLLAVAVCLFTWWSLQAMFSPAPNMVLFTWTAVCLAGSFISLAVGYMLRPDRA